MEWILVQDRVPDLKPGKYCDTPKKELLLTTQLWDDKYFILPMWYSSVWNSGRLLSWWEDVKTEKQICAPVAWLENPPPYEPDKSAIS